MTHLIDKLFQSDKYPTCPPGKVPLSCSDKAAQPLLWEYAQRRRVIDPEFSDDLEQALAHQGYEHAAPETTLDAWRARAERAEAELADRLDRISCAFCGHLGKRDDVADMQRHMVTCVKHPVHQTAQVVLVLTLLVERLAPLCEFVHDAGLEVISDIVKEGSEDDPNEFVRAPLSWAKSLPTDWRDIVARCRQFVLLERGRASAGEEGSTDG